MTTFKKYPKIHRLGKEEVEGILLGTCEIQEKIDGANAQIWVDKRGEVTCGSRNRELTEGFNGLVDYVKENQEIKNLLKDHPNYRLYGEWLVRHTIGYKETAYKKFYLFDITEVKDGEEAEEFKTMEEVYEIATKYNVPTPQHFGTYVNPTEEALKDFVGKSALGEKGEGVVIKNHTFRDKWGNHNYAKIVTEQFKENNAITFGGNNKYSDSYWEMYIVNKYITLKTMSKLTMLQGLPASGKSTKALQLVTTGNNVRLNRDLLRTMLHYDKWTPKNEGLTIEAQKLLAREYLNNGVSVVIDDTNLGDKHRQLWSGIAKETGSTFKVLNIDTNMYECIKRDKVRTDKKPVGDHVIVGMALQYGLYPYPRNGIVLCDIDGTLADAKHRLHHLQQEKKDWKAFFNEMHKDTPRTEVLDIVLKYEEKGYDIIIVSARPEDYRQMTEAWLEKAFKGYKPYKAVIMRRSGDTRPDTEVKEQMYETYFRGYPIEIVIDDRPRVIDMWANKGLDVIDVGDGIDF